MSLKNGKYEYVTLFMSIISAFDCINGQESKQNMCIQLCAGDILR
jgi:hypothetical protein